jgi:hypothetical protein
MNLEQAYRQAKREIAIVRSPSNCKIWCLFTNVDLQARIDIGRFQDARRARLLLVRRRVAILMQEAKLAKINGKTRP